MEVQKVMKFRNKENAFGSMKIFLRYYPDKNAHYEYHAKSDRPHWIIRDLVDCEK